MGPTGFGKLKGNRARTFQGECPPKNPFSDGLKPERSSSCPELCPPSGQDAVSKTVASLPTVEKSRMLTGLYFRELEENTGI